jgi:hypothetical protein
VTRVDVVVVVGVGVIAVRLLVVADKALMMVLVGVGAIVAMLVVPGVLVQDCGQNTGSRR